MDILEPPPQSLLQLKSILKDNFSFSYQIDGQNTITKEHSLVVKDIEKYLSKNEGTTAKILEAMNDIFANEIYLKKALEPSILKKKGVSFDIEQESLIRILLRVNQLQDRILRLILEEIINVVTDTQDCSVLRLLLNPLKYLPSFNDAKEFSSTLLSILSECTPEMQLEMLDVIPDIIPDSCYDTVAKELTKILDMGDSPWEAIIGCLGAFDFDDDVKTLLHKKLVNVASGYPRCLPATIRLLFNTHKGKIPLLTFQNLRTAIDREMRKTEPNPLYSEIMSVLRSVSNKEHFIQTCFDFNNSIKSDFEHQTFDMLILLLLGEETKCREMIRKKIESGHFTPELVGNMVKNVNYYDALTHSSLHESSNSLLKLVSYLLRYASTKVENFTKSLFRALLSYDLKEEKYRIIAKQTVECFVRACNNSDMKCVNQALRILYALVKENPDKFYDHLNQLMVFLKKMDDLDLHAASMAYKIICEVSNSLDPNNPQSEAVENDVNMMVRKQLMSSKRLKKSKGIMGAIMLLQADIISDKTTGDENNSDVEMSEIGDQEPPARTLTIMESVKVLTESFPECIGMFYDELASIVQKRPVNKDFSEWMIKRTRLLLDDYIYTHEAPLTINNVSFVSNNGATICGKSLTLNIGPMTVEPHKHENSPMILLPSLFRLYRIFISKKFTDPMHSKDYGALVGCSYMLPSLENLEDLGIDQLNQVVDVLYHVINYLKEVVDSTTMEPIHLDLFLDRFNLLIKLEGIFNDLLMRTSEHTFSTPYFNDCFKNKQLHEIRKKSATKNAKKRKIVHNDTTIASTSALSMNELNTSTVSVLTSKKHSKPIRHSKYLIEHNIHFREISVYSLFKMIQYSTLMNLNESEEGIQIGYDLLVFILRDVVRQLGILLRRQSDQKFTPEEILESILKDLSKAAVSFTELVKEMERLEVFDDENEGHCNLIMCFSYFLEMFHIILSVPVGKQCELVNKVHKALDVNAKSSADPDKTRKKLLNTFKEYNKISVVLTHGVLIYKVIESIVQYESSSHTDLKKALCENMVSKKWQSANYLQYSEKQLNQDTKFILEKYFKELKVEKLHELLTKVAGEYVDLKEKKDHLSSLPIINYSNFHILFVTLCTALHENVQKEIGSLRLNLSSNIVHLKLWKNTTSIMFIMMGIAKNVLNKNNILLSTFLKKSVPILRIFIAHALPIFDVMFSSKTETVVDILKSMQASTRFIHHLCCQSKMFKNLSVVSHIPGFRLVLEQLIYKVKALLVSHNCEEAFFLGNLKNKDIHGNTQTSEQLEEDVTQENEQDEDEEMVTDDDSDANMDDDRSESLTF